MALDHTKPPTALLRELNEVALAARALAETIDRGLNFPLPPEFPSDQLVDICHSLARLPEGTAEGARSPLDYARHRLPAIRRQYVISEDLTGKSTEPSLTRGAALDQKLTTLISAVSTAFDEYRSLASEEVEDFKAEAGIVPKKGSVDEATQRAANLDQTLAEASASLDEITDPASQTADDLKRQLKDARGLNQIASAEMRMPRVVVGWLRKSVDALKRSPAVIAKTVAAIRVGVDVSKVFVDRWHNFSHDTTNFVFTQINKTLSSFEKAAEIVGKAQSGNSPNDDAAPLDEPSQVERASNRRAELQRAVRTRLVELDKYGSSDVEGPTAALRDAVENELLTDLQELTRLETFIRMHRHLSGDTSGQRGNASEPPLGRAGYGLSKRIFARLAIIAIRRAGRPLESGEVVEQLRKIGHPVGGTHEIKTAYNRLWEAKTAGALVHIAGAGYWIADLELPIAALNEAAAMRAKRRKGRAKIRTRDASNARHGRAETLSDHEKEAARKMLSNKSITDVAAHFSVTTTTIRKYFRDELIALREQNGGRLPQRTARRAVRPRGPRKITKKLGRPPRFSSEQVAAIVALKADGRSVEEIASQFGVSIHAVYRSLRQQQLPKQ